jgi:hypothetical protein
MLALNRSVVGSPCITKSDRRGRNYLFCLIRRSISRSLRSCLGDEVAGGEKAPEREKEKALLRPASGEPHSVPHK